MKVVWKFAGACADSAPVRSLPLSLLTVSVYSNDELGVPRSDGRRDLMAELGRRLAADGQRERQVDRLVGALGVQRDGLRARLGILRHLDTQLQGHALVHARHRRGDRLAAAQDVGLPARRRAADGERQRLGREAGVLQLEADRSRLRRAARSATDSPSAATAL